MSKGTIIFLCRSDNRGESISNNCLNLRRHLIKSYELCVHCTKSFILQHPNMDEYLRVTLEIHAGQEIGEVFIGDDRQNH